MKSLAFPVLFLGLFVSGTAPVIITDYGRP